VSRRKLIQKLYEEYGAPVVRDIHRALGARATPEQIRREVERKLPSQNPLAVRMQQAAKPLAARPALPPPDPSKQLPPFAAKPRGGQWFTEKSPLPILAPRQALEDAVYMSERFSSDPVDKGLLEWWDRAAPRYIQNELGTPEDPLRALAERGLLHADMSPDEWSERASKAIAPFPLQQLLFDEGTRKTLGNEALASMPWLAKAPATDSLYGVTSMGLQDLNFRHIADEMRNALRPDTSGLPADLAVRPESLARMSFPQAVERVGRINQFRAKKMQEEAESALNNPAIRPFKEYPDAGYRWVELNTPDFDESVLPEGWEQAGEKLYRNLETGDYVPDHPAWRDAQQQLDAALKFEGDQMGHCVGGYCSDVMSGRSRIFSLRDAKGQPHVTIETSPKSMVFSDLQAAVGPERANQMLEEAYANGADVRSPLAIALERAGLMGGNQPQDIIQIKGKQNRAPTDDYLPYVQDFVKSGTWGNIGDFANTGLVKLPDGRYITKQQYDEGAAKAFGSADAVRDQRMYGPEFLERNWAELSRNFEGYAIGGRVSKDRCFSRHPMSVR
jgi:hypothetical protein